MPKTAQRAIILHTFGVQVGSIVNGHPVQFLKSLEAFLEE